MVILCSHWSAGLEILRLGTALKDVNSGCESGQVRSLPLLIVKQLAKAKHKNATDFFLSLYFPVYSYAREVAHAERWIIKYSLYGKGKK
jgi:hypothetical protein